jgi:hypothetical protein
MDIWTVWHIPPDDEVVVGEAMFIGIYSSLEAAHLAVGRLSAQPGFRDHPGVTTDAGRPGFFVEAYKLDEDHWPSGYRRPDADEPLLEAPPD